MDLSAEIEEIFQSSDSNKLEDECSRFSKRIVSKEIKLVILVEALGPKLTSTDVQLRAKAVEILANVFSGLPLDFLLEPELNFIVTFLNDRLKDQHLVIPKVILCIHAIIQSKNLPPGAGKTLLYQLFREANIQSHVHKIRRTFFLTVRYLVVNKLEELKEMTSDFVVSFLQAMEGEKDPRNLMLLFNFIPVILSHFPLDHFTEDFFEILACYFPIDFTPSVTVPGVEVITRESLADSLHKCLSHTNRFSSFLVPLALEKLESSLVDAKIDALNLLEMCCEKSYQPGDLEPFLGQIWHNLRREIFMGGNEIVEKHCVSFLKASFKMIAQSEPMLDHCLTMIFTECNHHLCEPDLRLIQPTSRILVGMADSCEVACRAVLQRTLPVLHDQLLVKSTSSEKKRILSITGLLISSGRQFSEVKLAELLPEWDSIIAMWFSLLMNDDPQFISLTLSHFIHVMPVSSDLPLEYRNMLQEHINSLLNSIELPQEARSVVVSVMNEFSIHYPEEFVEGSVNPLIKVLNEDVSVNEDTQSSKILAALAECSPNNKIICEIVVTFVLSKLKSAPYDIDMLNALSRIVEKGCCNKQQDRGMSTVEFIDLVCLKLNALEQVVTTCTTVYPKEKDEKVESSQNDNAFASLKDEKVQKVIQCLEISTGVVRNIVKSCSVETQEVFVKTYWGEVETVGVKAMLHKMPVLLLESLLGPLRPEINVTLKEELMQFLLNRIITSVSSPSSWDFHELVAAQRLYAVLLNKLESEDNFNRSLESLETSLERELDLRLKLNGGILQANSELTGTIVNDCEKMDINGSGDDNTVVVKPHEDSNLHRRKLNSVNLLVWTIKSLAMRGLDCLDKWVDKMVVLLEDTVLGTETAEGFDIIMSNCEVSLNPECFCKYRFLYKQRLFLMTVPKLVLAHKKWTHESAKANCIRALSCQLKHVPKQVLFMEINNVFPLLVASVSCEASSSVILISTLTALLELMSSTDSQDTLKEYFHDVTPRLLHLTRFKDSMQVRKLALSCLQTCVKFPTHVVLPLKQMVVDDLKYCLDDPKRLVRKEAAVTRNKWILIGEVGGH